MWAPILIVIFKEREARLFCRCLTKSHFDLKVPKSAMEDPKSIIKIPLILEFLSTLLVNLNGASLN
jgi:hypothetical protein